MSNRRVFILAAGGALAGCGGGAGTTPVAAPGDDAPQVLMDFEQPLDLSALPAHWRHRTFWRTPPMQLSWVHKDGRAALRAQTDASASMLYRQVNIPLDRFTTLRWGWLIEQPVVSDIDENSAAGDDHPARLFLAFVGGDGSAHAMEIIWGNRTLKAGDWKYLKSWWRGESFAHYTARGGATEVGRWHDEHIDLRWLYRTLWGDPAGARLNEVAVFCDTDQTGARSVAYFSAVRAEAPGTGAGAGAAIKS